MTLDGTVTLDGVVPWPDDVARRYREQGCWRGRPLGDYVWEWAQRWPDRTAVVADGHRLTYRELAERADRLAAGLHRSGLSRGDTVLMQLPNCWEFVAVTLALFRLGVVPVMMLPPHREYELTSIGAHVRAKALIVPDRCKGYDHQALAHRVAADLPEPALVLVVGDDVQPGSVDVRALLTTGPEPHTVRGWLDDQAPAGADVALFLLSGGTTGVPKVIPRTHDDYEYNIRCCAAACGFGPDTVYLAVLPAGHNFPLANPGILGALSVGGQVVLLPSPRADAVFEAIETHRVTATSAVPAVVFTWMEHAATSDRDISSLERVHVGGSVLSPEVAAQIGPALGCRLQQVYGMAEGLICYTALDAPDEITHHTQGQPISPYDELRLVDADGEPVPPGGAGELLIRGPYTPRGYFAAPGQNRLAFTPDGWYRTGDLIRITDSGAVVVCGRVKDQINRAGEKISAAEVETLVQEMPEVAEVAAVPVPDPAVGERVCVFVRPHAGQRPTLAGVGEFLTARGLAAFKLPERLELVDDIPHTPVGKPDKKALLALISR